MTHTNCLFVMSTIWTVAFLNFKLVSHCDISGKYFTKKSWSRHHTQLKQKSRALSCARVAYLIYALTRAGLSVSWRSGRRSPGTPGPRGSRTRTGPMRMDNCITYRTQKLSPIGKKDIQVKKNRCKKHC